MKGLSGRTAIVTGGSSGIGQAIAIRLGQEGVHVAVNYVGPVEGAEVTKEAIDAGVARCINEVRADRTELGVVLITHYQRLLDHVQPDHVHILVDGRIVDSRGPELARRLEREGYEAWRTEPR